MKCILLTLIISVAHSQPTRKSSRKPTRKPTKQPTRQPTRQTSRPTQVPTSSSPTKNRPRHRFPIFFVLLMQESETQSQEIEKLPQRTFAWVFHACLPIGAAGGCDGCLNLANPANFRFTPRRPGVDAYCGRTREQATWPFHARTSGRMQH